MVKKRKNNSWREIRKKSKKENLVVRRRKKIKDLIAPMLFSGSLNAEGFERWLEYHLLSSLEISSVLIIDNSPIHRKNKIKKLAIEANHEVLFSPKYSPDFNDIEHDFSALKKVRMSTSSEIRMKNGLDHFSQGI